MCERNCVYRGPSGCCDYSSVTFRAGSKVQTRHLAIARQLGVRPDSLEVKKRLKSECCTLYTWDGKGRKSITKEPKETVEKKKEYRPPRPEEEMQHAYSLGLSDRKMGERLGISSESVRLWRVQKGLESNFMKSRQRFDEAKAADLYRQGLGDMEIALEMGASYNAVWQWRSSRELPPNKVRKLKEAEREKLEQLYAEGATDRELADAVNMSVAGARHWRKMNGLPINYAKTTGRPDVDKDHIRRLYDKGMRDEEIAMHAGCSVSTVRKWRECHGLWINRPKRRPKQKR